MTLRAAALAGLLSFGILQGRPPVGAIVGTWRGTSICMDHAKDPACHDETVIYEVDSLSGPPGTVNLRADKVVNGVRDSMGTLRFVYQPATRTWSSEFTTPRFHGTWTFTITGDVMSGYLLELPSTRQVRRVSVKRSTTSP